MRKLLLISLISVLSGCVNLAKLERELAKDPAFVKVDIKSLSVSASFVRDGRPNNANTVSEGGAVTSTPSTNNVNNRP